MFPTCGGNWDAPLTAHNKASDTLRTDEKYALKGLTLFFLELKVKQ